MADRYAVGLKIAEEMLGPEVAASLEASLNSTAFGAQRGKFALGYVFSELWARPGLDRRGRSLVTLGMLIALRQPEELKIHVAAAIRNGCTVQEIEEAIYQATAYAGFPAASQAAAVAAEVLKARGLID
jgi:4-carboxymuconolactone decarboxylase